MNASHKTGPWGESWGTLVWGSSGSSKDILKARKCSKRCKSSPAVPSPSNESRERKTSHFTSSVYNWQKEIRFLSDSEVLLGFPHLPISTQKMATSSAFFLGLHFLNLSSFIWAYLDLVQLPFSWKHGAENWTPICSWDCTSAKQSTIISSVSSIKHSYRCVPGWHLIFSYVVHRQDQGLPQFLDLQRLWVPLCTLLPGRCHRLSLFVGGFWIRHFPQVYLLSSIWFLSVPLCFSGSIWIQTLSSYGKWYRWLMDKMIIYLSLGTNRVANLHCLYGLVLERQGKLVYPKDHNASEKLLLVSLPY